MTALGLPDEMCAEDAVAIFQLMAERDRFREALVRIANAQSGVWGRIAREALHPKQTPAEHGKGRSA